MHGRAHTAQSRRYEVNKPSRDNMKKYLTGMKRKAERDGDNETNESHQKANTRKYDKAYVSVTD